MRRIGLLDRLQTVVVTATITSAVWIVVGTFYVGSTGRRADEIRPDPTAPASSAASVAAEDDEGPLTIPVLGVTGAQLVDSFADSRGGRPHEAIDIPAPAGTPVVAAAPGRVEKLFFSDAGGNTIYVRSSDQRTIYYYAHLRDYAPGLAEGQEVGRGQRLGTVGSTGNADPAAPHLHFAIMKSSPDANWWEPASPLNPYALLGATIR